MGKKAKKTKELSVAIAEAASSSQGGDAQQHQLQTPRKRGRPRKIIEKLLEEDEEEPQPAEAHDDDITESEFKKLKTSEEEDHQVEKDEAASSVSARGEKRVEGPSGRRELPVAKQTSRSKARRKSKPRKSSS